MIGLGQILSGVFQRTTEGRLKWSQSFKKDRFITSVDSISIIIVEESDTWAGTIHRLEIVDEDGETVETLGYFDATDEQNRQLERLFVLARRSALDIDTTLKKLAKGLEL